MENFCFLEFSFQTRNHFPLPLPWKAEAPRLGSSQNPWSCSTETWSFASELTHYECQMKGPTKLAGELVLFKSMPMLFPTSPIVYSFDRPNPGSRLFRPTPWCSHLSEPYKRVCATACDSKIAKSFSNPEGIVGNPCKK